MKRGISVAAIISGSRPENEGSSPSSRATTSKVRIWNKQLSVRFAENRMCFIHIIAETSQLVPLAGTKQEDTFIMK